MQRSEKSIIVKLMAYIYTIPLREWKLLTNIVYEAQTKFAWYAIICTKRMCELHIYRWMMGIAVHCTVAAATSDGDIIYCDAFRWLLKLNINWVSRALKLNSKTLPKHKAANEAHFYFCQIAFPFSRISNV